MSFESFKSYDFDFLFLFLFFSERKEGALPNELYNYCKWFEPRSHIIIR